MSGLNTYVRLLAAASIGLSQITVGVSARAAEGAERPASIVFEGVPITPMVKAEIQHAAEVGDLTRVCVGGHACAEIAKIRVLCTRNVPTSEVQRMNGITLQTVLGVDIFTKGADGKWDVGTPTLMIEKESHAVHLHLTMAWSHFDCRAT